MARGDGLRVQMSAIRGLTKGRTQRLLTPNFRFQCPPLDNFQHDHGHAHSRTTNYQGEEFLNRGGRRLATIPLRTLVVEYASWVVERRWDVEDMVEAFQTVSEEGWPFRLLATHKYGGRAEIDITAVLESCSVIEQANEQDARYLDLQFSQYNDRNVTRRSNRRSGPAKPYPYTITLRADGTWSAPSAARFGQPRSAPLTLASIATYAYGQPSRARFLGERQKPALNDWGSTTPLVRHPRFKKGGKIVVPEPPEGTGPHTVRGTGNA